MTENVSTISQEIKRELDEVKDRIIQNGAIQTHSVDTFSPGPTQTKINNLENNEASVKASYARVGAHLYETAMPVLNRAAVKVSESEQTSTFDKNVIETLGDQITTEFKTIETQELAAIEQANEKTLEQNTKVYSKIKQRFDQLEGEYNLISQKLRRYIPVIKFKSSLLYYALLSFIGICEIPLNIVIFQSFGENDYITMIMAGTLAIAIPVLAHFIGMFWKQRSEMKDYTWKAVTLTSIFLATNVGLAVFRANVLNEILIDSGQVVTQSDFMLNVGIFLGITTLLFLIGVVAAYFRHDESYTLEHSYKNYSDYLEIYNEASTKRASVIESCENLMVTTKRSLADRYVTTVANVLNRPVESLKVHNNNIADYEHALEAFRGLEMRIQADYNYIAGALSIPATALETKFTKLKEFFIQK